MIIVVFINQHILFILEVIVLFFQGSLISNTILRIMRPNFHSRPLGMSFAKTILPWLIVQQKKTDYKGYLAEQSSIRKCYSEKIMR